MRVAIVTESFLPQVNGVTNSVRHVADNLAHQGHDVIVVAPGSPQSLRTPSPYESDYNGIPVVRARSLTVPVYRSFPVGLPDRVVEGALSLFKPDVVHLASPIALGAVGMRAANRLGIPTVAVYQTDIPGFLRQYGLPGHAPVARWVGRVHRKATRNLVPSRASYQQLSGLGVTDLHLWGRGVNLDLFDPKHRNERLHQEWARNPGDLVVGYVGRLAAEKQVRRLHELSRVPGISLVVIGDGPEMRWLSRNLPDATFTGMLAGRDLARAFASLDTFVHTGEHETFCQTVQEAQASGVPVVAPAAGGPLDLIKHGTNGLLYDPHAPRALRSAVQLLAEDSRLRADLAADGLASVSGRTWAAKVAELVGHYDAAIGARANFAAA